MFKIKLTLQEFELLEQCIELDKLNEDSSIILEISENNLENIIENISKKFIIKGIKKNFEPNNSGLELENLNDKFLKKLQEEKDKDKF